ncbi:MULTISPECIES: 2'-5' RNA ligase family protein [unclassified Pseudomonas]|uniref:2'-5' RNA ligase family protein n=1 Tax=unclassified Pseudomonas TaxID=196821 RepID=UPI0024479ED3|nr:MULTISPECIES: 2'-5' RNA ligase family protein [unclassified Pseudomonas]MDG9924643.1 2'-5' RNA ligase family protein [Pseudomonas sp. GD04045]MDH0033484.1 2'-5' RNA ligase family protein [Pseudomonas sp. GD04019]
MRLSDSRYAPAATLASELRDHPDWHLGRQRYSLWALAVECPAVLARMQAARQLLGDWLHPPGVRQAHITLFVCGFPCTVPRYDDDIALERLDAQRRAIQALRMAPLELRIGGLDSFASAAFLSVQEDGQLDQLRQALAQLAPEVRQAEYVPHITVGLYRQAVSAANWRQRAMPLFDCPPLRLPVREVQLLSYAAAEPQGSLRIEARVALA